MTIQEMLNLFIENNQLFSVYDITSQKEIFKGDSSECDDYILDCEICTIDNIYRNNDGYICFNIEL